METSNTLKTVAKTYLFWLKVMNCGKNTMKFGMWLKSSIKFHRKPIYNQNHLNAKVREFDGEITSDFLGNELSKENMHYTCIPRITTPLFINNPFLTLALKIV